MILPRVCQAQLRQFINVCLVLFLSDFFRGTEWPIMRRRAVEKFCASGLSINLGPKNSEKLGALLYAQPARTVNGCVGPGNARQQF